MDEVENFAREYGTPTRLIGPQEPPAGSYQDGSRFGELTQFLSAQMTQMNFNHDPTCSVVLMCQPVGPPLRAKSTAQRAGNEFAFGPGKLSIGAVEVRIGCPLNSKSRICTYFSTGDVQALADFDPNGTEEIHNFKDSTLMRVTGKERVCRDALSQNRKIDY